MKKRDPKVLKAAYKSIFSGEMGKIVMEDLKDWCHILNNAVVPGDPHMTHFNLGKQFIYQRIVQMAKINLDQIMQKEASSDTR
jgi:hypothetical protein